LIKKNIIIKEYFIIIAEWFHIKESIH